MFPAPFPSFVGSRGRGPLLRPGVTKPTNRFFVVTLAVRGSRLETGTKTIIAKFGPTVMVLSMEGFRKPLRFRTILSDLTQAGYGLFEDTTALHTGHPRELPCHLLCDDGS